MRPNHSAAIFHPVLLRRSSGNVSALLDGFIRAFGVIVTLA
jgi:hypothetical protein